MPIRVRCLITSLFIAVSGLTGSYSMATERNPGASTVPGTYRLDEVGVRITQSPGRAASTKNQILKLSGSGEGTLERNSQTVSFRYESKALLALLNDLYRIRFFDLPANYSVGRSVVLKDDGTVGTQFLKMTDAPSTSVCFSLPVYEKCVTYGSNGPQELESVVRRLWDEADQWAKASSNAK
jgi:hypothetical protein